MSMMMEVEAAATIARAAGREGRGANCSWAPRGGSHKKAKGEVRENPQGTPRRDLTHTQGRRPML